jgi:DNA-binding MarR family transcriptional regulator
MRFRREMSHDVGADDQTIPSLVFHVSREVRTALERQLTSHGITAQQATLARLLRAWERKKRPSPFQIAGRLGTDGAGMSRLLDRLEAKGVVVRQIAAGDRRSISIELTETGRAIAARATPAFQVVNKQLLEGFTPKEVEQLTSMLLRLRENARKLDR